MPHLTLHYTANLDGFAPERALAAANRALVESGEFDALSIKSRALALDHFRIGDTDQDHGFIHVILQILPGRPEVLRRALGQRLHDAIDDCLPAPAVHCQLCVEVTELEAATYIKGVRTPEHAA